MLGRRPPLERPSARTVDLAGRALAQIHTQGLTLEVGRGLRLPHADWGPFVREGLSPPRPLRGWIGKAADDRLLRQIDRARELLQTLGRARRGLLHGDFHQGNYVLHRKSVSPIDFAECGFAPFVCDLATALRALAARPEYARKRAALLRGYRMRRDLPAQEEEALDALVAVRVVMSLCAVLARPDHPYRAPRIVRRYLELSRDRLREVGVTAR